jgi:hypothetical protein
MKKKLMKMVMTLKKQKSSKNKQKPTFKEFGMVLIAQKYL